MTPKFGLAITTFELGKNNTFVATLTHTFFGDTEEEAKKIVEAHKKYDAFFAASFTGEFNGIILRNSEPNLFRV